jgi:uncharacterized protein YbaR (Trm112 family)
MNQSPNSIDPVLLAILRCPRTRAPLHQATLEELEKVNQQIASGTCRDAAGDTVADALESALVSQCGSWLYPIRDAIPTMIADEAILM